MPVYVIAEMNGNDVVFRVVSSERGLSPLYRLAESESYGSPTMNGNPYMIFGSHVAQWTGKSKYDCPIVVSRVTSGSLVSSKL